VIFCCCKVLDFKIISRTTAKNQTLQVISSDFLLLQSIGF
jgi:hypothetical protein